MGDYLAGCLDYALRYGPSVIVAATLVVLLVVAGSERDR